MVKRASFLAFFIVIPTSIYATTFWNQNSISAYNSSAAILDSENWQQEFDKSGDIAFIKATTEVGVNFDTFSVSSLCRTDSVYKYHNDTSEVYHLTKNQKDLVASKTYTIDLQVNNFNACGVKIGKTFDISGHNLTIYSSLLKANSLKYGSITGSFLANTSKSYDYDTRVDYYYHKDTLFNRNGFDINSGRGIGIDLTLAGKINNNFAYNLQIKDLFTRIKWDNAPHTIATAKPANNYIDSDGYLHTEPSLTGVEKYKSLTQKVDAFVNASFVYSMHNYNFLSNIQYLSGFTNIGVGVKKNNYQALYYINTQSLKLSFDNHTIHFTIGVDNIDINKAKAFNLSFGFIY